MLPPRSALPHEGVHDIELEFFRRFVKGPGRRVDHAHYCLACVLLDLGRHDEAAEAVTEAILLDGKDERYQAKRREIVSRGARDRR